MKEHDIPVVAHVPGVGQNLQDHLELYVAQKCKKPITLLSDQKFPKMIQVGVQWFLNHTGSCATTHLESGGFTRSRPGVPHPDIMWHFLPSQVIDHGRQAPTIEAYQLHVGPMRQSSRGWIKLRSKDPREHPLIGEYSRPYLQCPKSNSPFNEANFKGLVFTKILPNLKNFTP